MQTIKDFITQTNHDFQDDGLSIDFNYRENEYIISKHAKVLATVSNNKQVRFNAVCHEMQVIYLIIMIDSTNLFLENQ